MPDQTVTAALLLTNRIAPVDGAGPLTAKQFWEVIDQVPDPADLLGLAAGDVQERVGCDPDHAERIVRLLDSGMAHAVEQERLREQGIREISALDAEFPQRLRARLGDGCPAVLLAAGPLDVASQGGVGVVGSRNVDEEGGEVARRAARFAVSHGLPVISGLARGVDQLAMAAALEADGVVVGVPTEGIRRVARSAEIRQRVGDERLVLLSPFGPDAPFNAGNAMGRNRVVYALADVTLVVATDDGKGGTWNGATEAQRRGYGPVAVWLGEGGGPGNNALVRKGCRGITDLDDLLTIDPDAGPDVGSGEQLSLGVL